MGDTAAELKTCAGSSTLKGLDVSSYEGNIDWAKVKAAGQAFTFIRVTDGVNTIDSKFAANWPGAKKAGVLRGAYQFFRPGQDPTQQANLFISKINAAGGFVAGDLPPVLDLESAGSETNATVVARAKTWLGVVEKALGVKPIVYTANFMSSVIGTNFSGYTLWVANYGTSCPTMPSGWSDWTFWQDADNGSVSGITGVTDTDIFNGTMADLLKLTKPGAPVAGPVITPVSHAFTPKRGAEGAKMGDLNAAEATEPETPTTDSAPISPCN